MPTGSEVEGHITEIWEASPVLQLTTNIAAAASLLSNSVQEEVALASSPRQCVPVVQVTPCNTAASSSAYNPLATAGGYVATSAQNAGQAKPSTTTTTTTMSATSKTQLHATSFFFASSILGSQANSVSVSISRNSAAPFQPAAATRSPIVAVDQLAVRQQALLITFN